MATYFLVNLGFIAVVLLIGRIRPWRFTKPILLTLIALLILTAVFDSVIVGLGIVAYDPTLISGLTIGLAPIEDFFYALLAVVVVPTLWHRLETKEKREDA